MNTKVLVAVVYGILVTMVVYGSGSAMVLHLSTTLFLQDGRESGVCYESRGLVDLVVVNNGDHDISVFFGDGHGNFIDRHDIPTGTIDTYTVIDKGDFNNDGVYDLAFTEFGWDYIGVLLGDGTGGFSKSGSFYCGYKNAPDDIVIGDFNRDGNQDIVASAAYEPIGSSFIGSIRIFLGNGTGYFSPYIPYPASKSGLRKMTSGDFNKDGFLDVAVEHMYDRGFSVFVNDGNGGFYDGVFYGIDNDLIISDIVAADFNNDGVVDLALPGSGIYMFRGTGDGTFMLSNLSCTKLWEHPGATIITWDWNKDGNIDLASAIGYGVGVYTGDGTGSFQLYNEYRFGECVIRAVTEDFNVDTKPDLALLDDYGNCVHIMVSTDRDGVWKRTKFSVGEYPQGIVAGDFNFNGSSTADVGSKGSFPVRASAHSEVSGELFVMNIGSRDSSLNWEISEYPAWGRWTFIPISGTNLTYDNGPVTVDVSLYTPDEPSTEFTGYITLVNSEDEEDVCCVPIMLTTQKSIPRTSSFLQCLERNSECFPVLAKFLNKGT